MEVNTFLNGLVGQGLDQSPSADAGRQKKGRKVYFELDMPDAPPLSWYDQLPVPEVKRRRSIEAITTTKTFQDDHCSIAVPWPVHKATGMIDCYGIVPVLHDLFTGQLLDLCSPWAWIWSAAPSSSQDQAWYHNHIYLPIVLFSKLSSLNSHNTYLRQKLAMYTTYLHDALIALEALVQSNGSSPTNPPKTLTNHHLRHLPTLARAQRKLLIATEQLVLHAQEMQHLITQLTLLIQTLTTMASKPDFLETTPDDQLERTRGELPDSLAGLAGTLPGFLPPAGRRVKRSGGVCSFPHGTYRPSFTGWSGGSFEKGRGVAYDGEISPAA
jgi:hypothetical protein